MTGLLPCGAPYAEPYPDGSGGIVYPCSCLWCTRCGQHTSSTWFGHHRSLCRVTGRETAPHFCCPDDCELGGISPDTAALVRHGGTVARSRFTERVMRGMAGDA